MIELKNVTKSFKKPIRGKGILGMFRTLFSRKHLVVKAVDNISFTIQDGEAVAYIGANGAGKSTTIKMMSGILTPTSGEILIDGFMPYQSKDRNKVLKNIGVVFGQKTQLWYDLPLTETYDLLKNIYEIPDEEYKKRLALLIDVLGLKPFMDSPVRTLSLGQRMRADLAASLIHNPKILFLDEPTIGLDVLVKRELIEAIKKIKEEYHTTLILTTHQMSDIEELCDRVIILDDGKIIFDGKLVEIKDKFGDKRNVTIQTKKEVNQAEIHKIFPAGIEKIWTSEEDHTLSTFTIDAAALPVEKLLSYLLKNYNVLDVKISETSIEQVVQRIYERKNV